VIAVDSSPLDDVSVLQRMAFVMARGDVYLGVTGRDLGKGLSPGTDGSNPSPSSGESHAN
jgi:hypothetical protein